MQTQENKHDIEEQKKEPVSFMNTLTSCVNKAVKDGYVDNFKVTKQGMYSSSKEKYYNPEDVNVINFYRFEGQSDPGDNSIMYVIETSDGLKGTLIDAYGAYSDRTVDEFIEAVQQINKKVNKADNTDKSDEHM